MSDLDELFSRNWREKLPPICPHCEYNLTGITSGRCPECGGAFLWGEMQQRAKRIYHELQCLDDMNEMVRIGYFVVAAGLTCLFLFEFLGLPILGRGLALLLGIGGFGAGVQIFRAQKLPRWTREYMPLVPNYAGGWINVLLGLSLVVGSVTL